MGSGAAKDSPPKTLSWERGRSAQYKWTLVNGAGSKPAARSNHSLDVIDGIVYVFGGEREARVPIGSEVWCLDVTSSKWWLMETKGATVPVRNAHASAVVGSSLYIFGGRKGKDMNEDAVNDMYRLDTATGIWSEVTASNSDDVPSPRSFHTMAAIGPVLYVFGGCKQEGRENDLHAFDTTTGTWRKLPAAQYLLERGGAGLVAVGDKLYVVGGFHFVELGDVHEFDTKTETWRRVQTLPELPPRSVHGVASLEGKIFAVGGEVSPPPDLNHELAGQFSSEVFVLDTKDEASGWRKLVPEGDTQLPPRGWFSTAALGDDAIVVFGGAAPNNSRLDDVYVLKKQ